MAISHRLKAYNEQAKQAEIVGHGDALTALQSEAFLICRSKSGCVVGGIVNFFRATEAYIRNSDQGIAPQRPGKAGIATQYNVVRTLHFHHGPSTGMCKGSIQDIRHSATDIVDLKQVRDAFIRFLGFGAAASAYRETRIVVHGCTQLARLLPSLFLLQRSKPVGNSTLFYLCTDCESRRLKATLQI